MKKAVIIMKKMRDKIGSSEFIQSMIPVSILWRLVTAVVIMIVVVYFIASPIHDDEWLQDTIVGLMVIIGLAFGIAELVLLIQGRIVILDKKNSNKKDVEDK